jgi:hypothetical protein
MLQKIGARNQSDYQGVIDEGISSALRVRPSRVDARAEDTFLIFSIPDDI